MYIWFYCLSLMLLTTCTPEKTSYNTNETSTKKDSTNIIVGAERIAIYEPLLRNKKVGLVVNQTSRVGNMHLVDSLLKWKVDIQRIFAPEHGFRGQADAGESIKNDVDEKTGISILSLYGSKKKPSPKDLKGIEVVVFDIQDVGCRFYTYISTLHYIMEACAENQIPLIVLDRPNPNAYFIDGPVLESKYKSFVGMHPVPIVYGMTIGEYAQMINGEGWLANSAACDLTVIDLKNYTHDTYYELPIKPSPNLPNMHSILLYPSLCLFEGTTFSVGRGTDKQFQIVGHPAAKGNYSFTPQPNEGAKDPPLLNQLCHGQDLSTQTIGSIMKPKAINLSYLIDYHKQMKGNDFYLQNLFFDKLAGTDQLRKQIMEGKDEKTIRLSWQLGLEKFNVTRKKYLIYK